MQIIYAITARKIIDLIEHLSDKANV